MRRRLLENTDSSLDAVREIQQRLPYLLLCLFHHAILYSALAIHVGLITSLFYFHLTSNDVPKLTGQKSLLKMEPRLSIVPQPDYMTRLIRIKQGKKYTYRKYMDDLVAFTQAYELHNAAADTVMEDCAQNEREVSEFNARKACRFDINGLGPCNIVNDFGYDDGMPCVVIKVNRIYGWIPRKQHPDGIRVKCEGASTVDNEYMGPLCYYGDMTKKRRTYPDDDCEHPDYGVLMYYYFPYMKQANYHSPLVFMEFRNATRGIVMMIQCYMLGDYDSSTSVTFELLID